MFTWPKERLTEKRHLSGRSQYIGAWWSYRNGSARQIARISCSTTPRPEGALYGSAEEIISRLRELQAAGMTQVLINSGGDRPIESLRRFAKEVMSAMVEA